MPIYVKNNPNYGGDLINQKYAPLEIGNPDVDDDTQKQYTALFENRINFLNSSGLLRQLNLYAADWEAIRAAEEAPGALPPVVVVSSNRADWISKTWDPERHKHEGNFVDVNDVRALAVGNSPWYSPQRINDVDRHVYIVVHYLEYDYYQTLLQKTAMTVIGWEFAANKQIKSSTGRIIRNSYLGFGASRFAALEFCKYVFNIPRKTARDKKAWLVDDNLVYVRGFPGFRDTEKVMNDDIWGLGFTAATTTSSEDEIRLLATKEEQQKAVKANLGKPETRGLLQQCVLWNIGQLNSQFLNYSPYFITSNEDTSLSNFLQDSNRLWLFTGARVFKGKPDSDGSSGAQDVAFLRDRAVGAYYDQEKNIEVVPTRLDQGKRQALSNYITEYVLPKTPNETEDARYTESKAVEQLMAKTVSVPWKWYRPLVFRPNGNEQQLTEHFQLHWPKS